MFTLSSAGGVDGALTWSLITLAVFFQVLQNSVGLSLISCAFTSVSMLSQSGCSGQDQVRPAVNDLFDSQTFTRPIVALKKRQSWHGLRMSYVRCWDTIVGQDVSRYRGQLARKTEILTHPLVSMNVTLTGKPKNTSGQHLKKCNTHLIALGLYTWVSENL